MSLAQTNTANASHFAVTVNPELTPPPSPVFEEGGGTEIFEDIKEAMHPCQFYGCALQTECETRRILYCLSADFFANIPGCIFFGFRFIGNVKAFAVF